VVFLNTIKNYIAERRKHYHEKTIQIANCNHVCEMAHFYDNVISLNINHYSDKYMKGVDYI